MQDQFKHIRKIRQGVRRFITNLGLYVGPILVTVTIILGFVGYSACDPAQTAANNLYKSLQNLALAYDETCALADNAVLNISRFMAAGLLAFAVVRLLFSKLWASLEVQSQALFRYRRRYILIGYGAVNQAIARELIGRGCSLTVLARSFDGAARNFAASSPMILIERNVRDAAALRGLYPNRAIKIIIACGVDSVTVETAQAVSALIITRSPEDVVFAHFSDVELHRQVQLSRDIGLNLDRQFTSFAIREEMARNLLSRTWLAERALRAGAQAGEKPRMHVVLVGAGDLGLALARETITFGSSAKLGRPLLTIIDKDGENCDARFTSSMPHVRDDTIPLPDRPEFEFISCKAESLREHVCDPVVPITAWIICCHDDATNLELALRLEGEMKRGLRPPAPIYPRQWQGHVHGDGMQRIGQSDPLHLVEPFGGLQDVVPNLSILDDKPLRLARAIHEEYCKTVDQNFQTTALLAAKIKYGLPPWRNDEGPQGSERAALELAFKVEGKRFNDQWSDLNNESRMANLASAHHAALRLWEIGYDWKHRYDGALPEVDKIEALRMFDDHKISDLREETNLGSVCAAEHRRWMLERALQGWSAAEPRQRNNSLRLHPDFRPYSELYSDAQSASVSDETNLKSADLRLLDAAVLRGITNALAHTTSGNPARFTQDAPPVSLLDIPELSSNVYRLVVEVPDIKFNDEVEAAKVERSFARLESWANLSSSFSIRFWSKNSFVWDNVDLKNALDNLLNTTLPNGVHISIDHKDVRFVRSKTKGIEGLLH